MSRFDKGLVLAAGVLIGALAVKALEASPAQAQSSSGPAISASAEGAWVVSGFDHVQYCRVVPGPVNALGARRDVVRCIGEE